MAASKNSDRELPQETRPNPEDLFHNGDAVAWESADQDLWIPHRVRGSWRGGVLG